MARLSLPLLTAVLATGTGVGAAAANDDAAAPSYEIGKFNNHSLLWGPYKPNLYLGIRPQTPQGLWTALMWSGLEDYTSIKEGFRYTCEQGQKIHGYGWNEYDARTGGIQTIHDEGNKIDLTTTFVKVPGGDHGGSWAVRIQGKLRKDAVEDHATTLFFYIAQEGGGELEVQGGGSELGFDGDVELQGHSEILGRYSVVVTEGIGRHPKSSHDVSSKRQGDKTLVYSLDYARHIAWQAKPAVYQLLQQATSELQEEYGVENLPPPWQLYRIKHKPGQGDVHIVQKTFEGSFSFDVLFSSASAVRTVTSEQVSKEAKHVSAAFHERFAAVFDLKAPFTAEKYKKFGMAMFSNLLGGVGFFHGEQIVDRSYAPEYEEEDESFWIDAAEARARGLEKPEGPYHLFTAVPSRPFFPRGFLWDEGFHLLPIADWDIDMTLEMVKSWYGTMDADGWIAREQILSVEARSKVPAEFQVQYPHYANPPTLFLVVDSFVERLAQSKRREPMAEKDRSKLQASRASSAYLDEAEAGEDYLRQLYPLLRRQYDWFRRTQRGDVKLYDREAFSAKEAYRWRGRTESHCLPSGLDDYPRAQPPHPGELHVDLLSWVGLMTKSLIKVAGALGMAEEVEELGKYLEGIERNLDDLHWSEEAGCYCDATVNDFEEHQLVCHKGYVSLLPFLAGLMRRDDEKMGRVLAMLGDARQLWSEHGIRSLSLEDALYGTQENYWRSPVWMPLNYMAVTQLQTIATQEGPYQKRARALYRALRRNLVETVYKSWEATGFAWEQYDPATGAGQRTQHFTGWTSLVVKLMAMDDLADADDAAAGGGAGASAGSDRAQRDEL